MIKPRIEFCVDNLASGSHAARAKLGQDPNLDIIEKGCLGYCGKCAASFYALVNGKPIQGDTPSKLVQNIYHHLEDNPIF
ncbi:YuzB family protein [Bacillus sp. EB01]|uniref:YuzB family protein n=1 Tax=Bacillus sp. EB01 TaxID=1347086 RepID=UPI0005C696E8|nr:YuzB family protein [Bacillus sp. EB01]